MTIYASIYEQIIVFTMKILIVEDQENLARLIKDGLENDGFSADYVLDGLSAQKLVETKKEDYDLILLDLMLPKKNGLAVCRAWRDKKITTPILIITAKDSTNDIIEGLNAGADDYLVKPFSFEVLTARINALLRRPKTYLPVELKTKDLTLDLKNKTVVKNKIIIKLTIKEFSLLEHLMRNSDNTVNREEIISNIWGFDSDSFSNVIDVHINNLRKKIGDQDGKIIEAVHGLGYRINS